MKLEDSDLYKQTEAEIRAARVRADEDIRRIDAAAQLERERAEEQRQFRSALTILRSCLTRGFWWPGE